EKTSDEKEAEKNIQRCKVILDLLEINGPKPSNTGAQVLKALKEASSDKVRAHAARWLGRTATKAKQDEVDPRPAIEALAEVLKTDKVASVREAAATALGEVARVRTDLRAAVPALTDALKDEDPAVRTAAAATLGRLGNDATPAVAALIDVVQDRKGD